MDLLILMTPHMGHQTQSMGLFHPESEQKFKDVKYDRKRSQAEMKNGMGNNTWIRDHYL